MTDPTEWMPVDDGSSLGSAVYDVPFADVGTAAAAGQNLTAKDGLAAFNQVLSAWLVHDTASMRQNQPIAYGGAVSARPAASSNLLLLIGLGAIVYVALED